MPKFWRVPALNPSIGVGDVNPVAMTSATRSLELGDTAGAKRWKFG